MASRIAEIVDASAAVAARVQGLPLRDGGTVGVTAVFGAGGSGIGDPLRPGSPIAPAPDEPMQAYSHFSDLPDAPTVDWLDQEADLELTWSVPMRLWLPRSSLPVARQTGIPFYAAYLSAFAADRTLGGLCDAARITAIAINGDDKWNWVEFTLEAIERVEP